jgi:prepilin-type N-terminal cleavage/methylation domain-containing protein
VSVARVDGRNRGFTLIELTVVLALLGLIGGVVAGLLLRQQRFYGASAELIYAREGVRDALEVLSVDIRGAATADTVRLLADSAIELFTAIGTSVVCQSTGLFEAGLAPNLPGSSARLTSFLVTPDTGDLALFLVQSDTSAGWERHRIAGLSSRMLADACPISTGFSAADDVAAQLLSVQEPLSAAVHRGTPVRFIRRGRYSLYRASDGDWYLGYRRCNAIGASVCGAIQPLSGPYRSYSSNQSATGILFEYFDAEGARITGSSAQDLARVDVTARAASGRRLLIEGRSIVPGDSGSVSISLRNRAR